MTTWILQLPPVTLKKDEASWTNDEIRFTVPIANPTALFQTPTNEKFQLFRYENEGYEKFLFWKRALESFFTQTGYEHQPAQKFKYTVRTLMGEAKEDWETLETSFNVNRLNQDDFLSVMCTFTRDNLPENPSQATLEYLREKAKLPDYLSIKDWIARIKTINSFMPLMQVDPNVRISKLNAVQLREIVIKNLPMKYLQKISESNLPRNVGLNEVQQKLMVYELNFSKERRNSEKSSNKKEKDSDKKKGRFNNNNNRTNKHTKGKFKNECRMHGGHEWEDCASNRNRRNKDKKKAIEQEKADSKKEVHKTSKKKNRKSRKSA